MEENDELEEGEALSVSGHEEEEDACADPDVALSYIDEKLQDVLGHFQKDFEGRVSAENLGAKFGGYGSFLPAYQRSPASLSQPRSPPKLPTNSSLRSPFNPSHGVACQKSAVQMTALISRNNTVPAGNLLENSGKNGMHVNAVRDRESVPKCDYHDRQVNGHNQNTLKARIKVGPDNNSVRNNAAIYSGLGLDFSPSPSPVDSPDSIVGHPPELVDVPHESPTSILQIMTCSPVLAGYLLSPLPSSLLHLTERGSLYIKKCRTDIRPENFEVSDDVSLPPKDVKSYAEKKVKSDPKNRQPIDMKNTNYKDDISAILERDIDIETLAGQDIVFDALNIPLLSSGIDCKAVTDSKSPCKPINISMESTSFLVNDRTSSSDLLKRKMYKESMENNKRGSCGNETRRSQQKQSSKLILTEKPREEIKTIKQTDASSDVTMQDKGDCDKGRKERVSGTIESANQKSVKKATSHEKNGENLFQGKNQYSKGKSNLKGSKTNNMPAMESSKENPISMPSVSLKEQKSFLARGSLNEANSNASKSPEVFDNDHCKEFQRDAAGEIKAEQVENRTASPELYSKDVLKHMNLQNEKSKEAHHGKQLDTQLISETSVKLPITTGAVADISVPTTHVAAAPCVPVVIKDNWVCCDKCEKWRLLPYGTNPDDLPGDWLCSMQTWLPNGMNQCNVSEEETNKAMHPQWHPSVLKSDAKLIGQYGIGASSTSLVSEQCFDRGYESMLQSAPTAIKKEHGFKDTSAAPILSTLTKVSHSMKKNQKDSSRSFNNAHMVHLEIDPVNKVGFDQKRKSTDFTAGKQKHRHKHRGKNKILGCFLDGGGLTVESANHSKLKSKRVVSEDGFGVAKKIKAGTTPDKDWLCIPDVAGESFPMNKSSSKEWMGDSRGNLERSNIQFRGHSDGELKEYFSASDMEKSDKLDPSVKKRKVEKWQESQAHQETLMGTQQMGDNRVNCNEEFSDSDVRKEKGTKAMKSERKESSKGKKNGVDKADGLTDCRELLADGIEEHGRILAKREHGLVQCQENVESRLGLDSFDSSKRVLSKSQPSAISSSSKVSGSHKSKANFQEARGSPVESVTSSPFRVVNADMLATGKNTVGKDDAISLGFSATEHAKRCSDGEVDARSGQSGQRGKGMVSSIQYRFSESQGTTNIRVPDPSICDYQDELANQLSGNQVNGAMHMKRSGGTHDGLLSPEFGECNGVTSLANTSSQHKRYIDEPPDKSIVHGQDKPSETTGKGRCHQAIVKNHLHMNGSSREKADKNSSFMEKYRSSEYDLNKCNLKVSNSLSEQDRSYSVYHGDSKDASYKFQKTDEKGYLGKEDANAGGRHHLDYNIQKNRDGHVPSMISRKHTDPHTRLVFVDASFGKSTLQGNLEQGPLHEGEKSLNLILSNHIGPSEMATGRGDFSTQENLETQNHASHSVHLPAKASRSEAYPTDRTKASITKVVKSPKRSGSQNAGSSMRLPAPCELEARSPLRKDGQTIVTVALKEARDLKHMANRLKSEGQGLESTSLYFQAALKFLHVASLWENGEVTRSMQMYIDTARLCDFCAREYEKLKEMTAAALAYKCIEVAYFKVLYYKQPISSKDRLQLQTAIQTVQRGESPSSSASDIDNLNNQGSFDKAPSAKGVASPHTVGNHVMAVRSSYTRWLDYTNETIFAFEASRKSQSAFAAATATLEKDMANALSSVKQVIELSFLNIEELLQLIRLSMEYFSH